MRSLTLLFGVFITLLLASSVVSACSCAGGAPPCESFGSASAVFVGTPVSVRENKRTKSTNPNDIDWTPIIYKFSVEQSYLGVPGTEIEVFTGRGGGDCGYQFKIGQRYLVYAYEDQNKLNTGICTRTKPFSSATEDLAFLGGLATTSPGVTIYGEVIGDEALRSDISIKLEGPGTQKEVRPDANGNFRISGLPAGKYKVSLNIPETLTTYEPQKEIQVADRGCAAIAWHLADNGRVSGRVIDAEGLPVARILVSLLDPEDQKDNHTKYERTDGEGRFNFSGVSRGRYFIAVNRNRYADPKDPTNAYPPTFYPGVVDQTHAQLITVGSGEKLTDFEIRIPLKRAASILNGSVVWSDGSPVVDAQLSIYDVTQGESNITYGAAADAQGRFRIEGYSGQKLIIQARSNRQHVPGSNSPEPMERSERLTITLQRPTETTRIVITKIR
jgi:hypothetical protein